MIYFIYDFWYNVLKAKYNDKIKLLFTDTDSLCFHVETEDFYKDMEEYKHIFDFSNYSEKHFLHNKEHKKKLGYMKDETEMLPIIEFIGLRAKCYSLIIETFDNFKDCYYN